MKRARENHTNISGDEEIRKALIEATKSISSDYHRGRVLTAAFK